MTAEAGRTALHGRDDLLALVRRRVPAVAGGAGHLLLLAGEAGIGKTRLLRALQELGRLEGFALWAAGAFPRDVELSAGLLLDLGHTMMRSERAEVAERGRAMVADVAQVSDDDAADGDAHRRRRLLVLASAERLAALADDGPALLSLEDLHWCDELSLEVIAHLARRLPSLPLLVVGTLRTDELHDNAPVRSWRSRLLLQRMAEEVRLPRLDAAQTEAMVRSLLPGRPVARHLVELVHERSGGVPLHVEELVHAAAEGRLSADPSYVPESLAEAVLQRFAVLPPDARDAALAAAVIGRSFDLDLLARVLDRAPLEAAAGLDALIERQFLQEEAPGWYGFRHALIRDAVEAQAPVARSRVLHATIAEAARHRAELGGDAYRSAHHEAAGELEEASSAAAAAAARAAALSAHREALDLLHRAVRCHRGNDLGRAHLLARRAVEAAATDDNRLAARDFEEARALLVDDDLAAAALLPGLVAARHLLGVPLAPRIATLDEALALLERRSRRSTDEAEHARVRADLWAAKAAAYLAADALDPALEAAQTALSSAGGAERIRLHTKATLGCALVLSGGVDEGWAELEGAIARARELELEAEAARGYRILATTASVLVDYDRADHWLAEGINHTERTEQWNHRHYMESHLAHVLWCRGRWDAAARVVHAALADGEGGVTTRIIGLHVTGFLALGRGQTDQALAALREARDLGYEMAELQRFSPAVWGIAECALLTGDHATATELTEVGYRASHDVGDAASLFPFLVTGTRSRLAAQDPAAAKDWVARVSTDLRARAIPGTLPAVDHAEGLVHLAAGRTGKARGALAAARAAWSERDRWWEGQWAALDLARCAVAANRRTEAATLVEGVQAAATAVGARPLLDAADTIGARLDRHDAPQPWSPLTLRELEVATLVARGLTNREIAEELRFTVRTAGSHLEHISAKLGTNRRTEIAAWVTALDLGDGSGASPR